MLSRQQQAAVIYFAIPQGDRPMGVEEFAKNVAGCSVPTLYAWKKLPEFRDAVKSARAQYRAQEGDLFQQAARSRALMILMGGMSVVTDKDTQRKNAQAVLREVKEVSNAADTVSYKAYSDAQLIHDMFNRGFQIPDADLKDFQELVGLEDLS